MRARIIIKRKRFCADAVNTKLSARAVEYSWGELVISPSSLYFQFFCLRMTVGLCVCVWVTGWVCVCMGVCMSLYHYGAADAVDIEMCRCYSHTNIFFIFHIIYFFSSLHVFLFSMLAFRFALWPAVTILRLRQYMYEWILGLEIGRIQSHSVYSMLCNLNIYTYRYIIYAL